MRALLAALALGAVLAGPAAADHLWVLTPKFLGLAWGDDLTPRPAQVVLDPPCAGPVVVRFTSTVLGSDSANVDAMLTITGLAGPAPACVFYEPGLATFEVVSANGNTALFGWDAGPHPGEAAYFRGVLAGRQVEMFSAGV